MMDAENFEKAKKSASDNPRSSRRSSRPTASATTASAAAAAPATRISSRTARQTEQGGRAPAAAARSRARPTRSSARARPAGGVSWSQDNKKFSIDAHRPAQGRRPLGHQLAGESAADARDLQVRDAGRGEPAAGRAARRRHRREEGDRSSRPTASRTSRWAWRRRRSTNLQREKGETPSRWLAPGSDKIYFNRTSRDLKRIDIVVGRHDHRRAEGRRCRSARTPTSRFSRCACIDGGKQLIHWSERDGWGHYYLYDASGKMIRQITSGEFVATGITAVDEKTRTLYFTGVGREAGRGSVLPRTSTAPTSTPARSSCSIRATRRTPSR